MDSGAAEPPESTGPTGSPYNFAAKGAVLAQLLRVVGKGDLPAQLVFKQVTGGFLHEDVFGVVVTHGVTSLKLF